MGDAGLFDPRKVPFSTRGSFLAISWLADDGAFWLRNLRGGDEHTDLGRMLRLEVLDAGGEAVEAAWSLTPGCLRAVSGGGEIRFSFDGGERISIAGRELGLRLAAGASQYNYAQGAGDHVHVCIARQDMRCDVRTGIGSLTLSAPWNGIAADRIILDILPDGGAMAASLDLFRVVPGDGQRHDQAGAEIISVNDFQRFLDRMPLVPEPFAAGRRLASYILWSGYVPAEGMLTRPAIYMSKNWMTNIWSWDHCFVARALASADPEAAFAQMQVIFDAQHPSGRLPDYINDRFALWAFTKPPVHGWTFARLRAAAPEAYGPDRMARVLGWLEAQVEDWLSGPGLGPLPAYRHGNDGGWDNSTIFSEGGPVVSPDLATFLILQLDEIATLHRLLGAPEKSAAARARAEGLCDALCRDLWDGAGFVARLQTDGRIVRSGQSLQLFLPLLLGRRLPEAQRRALLAGLTAPGRFLTGFGLATEATDSDDYRPNGYWRGPIWAPTTDLMVEALRVSGAPALADDVARRFLRLCCRSGMAENFDALTGDGLHDPAFAWTSAVFLTHGRDLPPARPGGSPDELA